MQLDQLQKEVEDYLYHDPVKKRIIDAAFQELREKQTVLSSEKMNIFLKLTDLWEAKVAQYATNLAHALSKTQKDLAEKTQVAEHALGTARATPTKSHRKIKTAHAYQEAKKETFQQDLNQLAQKDPTAIAQQKSKVKKEPSNKKEQNKEKDIPTKPKLK